MHSSKQNELVRQALEQVLESEGFAKAPQLRRFLDYVVRKTLDGSAHKIKGYTIGVEALGRNPDFDPQTDPAVRVMAGRLRQTLDNYNREAGGTQPAQISIPKGSYVPVFSFADEATRNDDANKKTTIATLAALARVVERSLLRNLLAVFAVLLIVAAIIGYAAGYFKSDDRPSRLNTSTLEAAQLPRISVAVRATDKSLPTWFSIDNAVSGTASVFSKFKEFRIHQVDDATQPVGADKSLAEYHFSMLVSRVDESEDVKVNTILTRQSDGVILWSNNTLLDEDSETAGTAIPGLGAESIAPLLSPYGVIYGNIAEWNNVPSRLHCINLIYGYFMDEDASKYSEARNCAENYVRSGTASSSMHALLAFIHVEAYRRQVAEVGEDPLAMAGKASSKALELDPQNARAHQARFAVHKIRGHQQKAIKSASTAMALNPYDSDIVGDFAAYLVSIGKLEEAAPLLTKTLAFNYSRPAWLKFYTYLHADLSGEFEQADQLAELIDPDVSPMAAVAVALAALRNGDTKKSKRALRALARSEPDFIADPATALLRRGFDHRIAERIAAQLVSVESKTRDHTLRAARRIPSGPKIAILPIQQLNNDPELSLFSRGFAIRFGHDLSRFKDLYLISTHSSLALDKQGINALAVQLDYLVQGTIARQGDNFELIMQLLQASDERVLWSQTYTRKWTAKTFYEVQNQISADIAARLGAPNGLIKQLETRRIRLDSNLPLSDYACTLNFFNYAADKSQAAHLRQRKCLLDVTESIPHYARAWSMLSWIYGDEVRFHFNLGSVQQAKDDALRAAQQGVRLDSDDFFTHQYLAEAYQLRDQDELAKKSLERALQLNPNDSDLLASFGWHLAHDGDWKTAVQLTNKAIQLNPAHPAWYRTVLFLDHYRKREYQKALSQVDAHPFGETLNGVLGRAVALQKLGRHREAAQYKRILQRDFGTFLADPASNIANLHLPADFTNDILKTLKSIATDDTAAGD